MLTASCASSMNHTGPGVNYKRAIQKKNQRSINYFLNRDASSVVGLDAARERPARRMDACAGLNLFSNSAFVMTTGKFFEPARCACTK